VTLHLGARLPPALQGKPVEYSYRVDGGFYRPFTDSPRVVLRDPLLWLQGQHTIEVMARVQDAPLTLDPTPVKLSLTIDRVPPTVRLVSTATGVRAEAADAVTPPAAIELSWSVDGGPYGPFGDMRELTVPAGTQSGTRFRLKGLGVPALNGAGRGDQYVTLQLLTPTKLSDEQRRLLEELALLDGEEKDETGLFERVKSIFS